MPAPNRFRPRCLPTSAWPTADQEAWDRAFQKDDLFGQTRVALSWRQASLNKTRKGFGVWTSWLRARRRIPAAASSASLVVRENVRSYVADLETFCAPYTVFCRIQELYDAIRILEPDRDWTWLLCAVRKLRSRAKPVREKLSRLKPADMIEELGFALMRRADAEHGLSRFKRSLLFRDGFAVAFLIRRPLRLGNFASIRIGVHLVGDNLDKLVFRATEMKSKRPFEVPFPPSLRQALHRYLDVYRPYLLSLASASTGVGGSSRRETALWISSEGRAVDPGAFGKSITKRTRAAFRRALTPHLFRDASVTTLVRDAPASALLTKGILDHGSIDVPYGYYIQAQMIESSRRYADVVAALQGDGAN